MKRFLRRVLLLAVIVLAAAAGYGWLGYRDAQSDAETLRVRADALIEAGRGGAGLGVERRQILVDVEDPAFLAHVGVDFTTPGAGSSTISQDVARQLGFGDFQSGIGWLPKTGYALALERNLTKPQILALFLDSVEMGAGPDGTRILGLWPASQAHFGADPDALARRDFVALVAMMIAPGDLRPDASDPRLEERVTRIERLVAGECRPIDHDDIWLEGCVAG